MDDSTAPAGESSAPLGSEAPPAAAGTPTASADVGSAPDIGGDAQVGAQAADSPAIPTEFLFANRKFKDQKHAEEIIGSEVGRVRGLQKQNAELQKRLQALESQLTAPRPEPRGNGRGQAPEKDDISFAEKLAKSGELEFYVDQALNAEGQVTKEGLMRAFFALTQDLDKHHSESLQKAMEDARNGTQSIEQRIQQEKTLARAFTAAKDLVSDFPELDDGNQAEGIEDVQGEILDLLQSGPPVQLANGNVVPLRTAWLAEEPKEALRWAVETYRRQHGTPVFAQPPGTSESPSAKAAAAAERNAAKTAATVEGSGTPRQGQGPQGLEAEWRRDSAKLRSKEAKTPSGRPLGFAEPS